MPELTLSHDKWASLLRRLKALEIREEDLEESFVRSSGPGGQNVNKLATCVYLKHRPSGIAVKCQQTRSQLLNRYYARCLLAKEAERRRALARRQAVEHRERLRRQNRKRSKASQERMLQEKRRRSEIKSLRKNMNVHQPDD